MFVIPTCALKTLQCGGESFGPGQQVVFELGQAFTFCNLHTDLMLRLCEAGALAIQEKLWREKSFVKTHTPTHTHTHTCEEESHRLQVTSFLLSLPLPYFSVVELQIKLTSVKHYALKKQKRPLLQKGGG